MLDKLAFAMSKIDKDENADTSASVNEKSGLSTLKRGASTDLAADVGSVSLEPQGSFVGRGAGALAGPSLLTQTAPSATRPVNVPGHHLTEEPTGVSSSVMSIDQHSDKSSTGYEGIEKITVKIADLGNGG